MEDAGRKKYPDLRYKFIRGLIQHERNQRRAHYLKSAAEWTSRAIVSLELADKPVKSVKQATKLEGIGGVLTEKLKTFMEAPGILSDPPPEGTFLSSAPALLVAMLNAKEELISEGDKQLLVPEQMLKTKAQSLSQEAFLLSTKDIIEGKEGNTGLCMAWWRVNVLSQRLYIKKRTLKKQPVYELLPAGEEVAHRLRGTKPGETVQGQVDKGRPSKAMKPSKPKPVNSADNLVEEERALYTNDNGSDGLVLLVDMREWGGDRVKLGELHRYLCELGVRHRTSSLQCGDYSWVWKCAGVEHVLPVLVERKRADDLAWSLKDGRYFAQKNKMLEFRRRFSSSHIHCSLKYVVESGPEQYMVRCADGCRGVARCGNPTVEQVNNVLEELDTSDDFDLVRTLNIEGTVEFLASVTAELQQRLDAGDFDALAARGHVEEQKTTDTKKEFGIQGKAVPPPSVNTSPDGSPIKAPSLPPPDISPVRSSSLTKDSPQKSLLWNTTKTSPFKDTAEFRSKVRGYGSTPSPEKTIKDYFPVSPASKGQGAEGKVCRKSLNAQLMATKSADTKPLLSPSRRRAVGKMPDFGDNSPLPKVQAMYDPTEYTRNRYRGDFWESSSDDIDQESQGVDSTDKKDVNSAIQKSVTKTKATVSGVSKQLNSGFEDISDRKYHSDIDVHLAKASREGSCRKRSVANRSAVFSCDSDSDHELPDITDQAPSLCKQRKKESSATSFTLNTSKYKTSLEHRDEKSDGFSGHTEVKATPSLKVGIASKDTSTLGKNELSVRDTHENKWETVSLLDDSQETKDSVDDYDFTLWSMNAQKKKYSGMAAFVSGYKASIPHSSTTGNTVRTNNSQDSDRTRNISSKSEVPSTSKGFTSQQTSSSLLNRKDTCSTSNQKEELETILLLDDSQETRHSDDELDQAVWPSAAFTDRSSDEKGPDKTVEEEEDEGWGEKVQLVKAVLPQAELNVVLKMLKNNNGNIEAVVSALLDQAEG